MCVTLRSRWSAVFNLLKFDHTPKKKKKKMMMMMMMMMIMMKLLPKTCLTSLVSLSIFAQSGPIFTNNIRTILLFIIAEVCYTSDGASALILILKASLDLCVLARAAALIRDFLHRRRLTIDFLQKTINHFIMFRMHKHEIR